MMNTVLPRPSSQSNSAMCSNYLQNTPAGLASVSVNCHTALQSRALCYLYRSFLTSSPVHLSLLHSTTFRLPGYSSRHAKQIYGLWPLFLVSSAWNFLPPDTSTCAKLCRIPQLPSSLCSVITASEISDQPISALLTSLWFFHQSTGIPQILMAHSKSPQ